MAVKKSKERGKNEKGGERPFQMVEAANAKERRFIVDHNNLAN